MFAVSYSTDYFTVVLRLSVLNKTVRYDALHQEKKAALSVFRTYSCWASPAWKNKRMQEEYQDDVNAGLSGKSETIKFLLNYT